MSDENESRTKIKTVQRVKCHDCKCIGELRVSGREVLLFPKEVLLTRRIFTFKEDLRAPIVYKESLPKKFKISEQ